MFIQHIVEAQKEEAPQGVLPLKDHQGQVRLQIQDNLLKYQTKSLLFLKRRILFLAIIPVARYDIEKTENSGL